MIIVIPLALMAVAHMANNDSKLDSAFRFREILDKIRTQGWINLIGWYILTGILALIIVTIGNIITTIFNIINPIIGTVLISLIIIPYLYIYISRSIPLFYISSNLQIRKYIGLIIILILAFLVLSFSASYISNIANSKNIKAYNSTTNTYSGNGISFNYPSNWNIQTDNQGGNNIIMIVSNNATFQISIQISPNPPGMSDQEAITGIQNSINPDGFQKISNNTLTIDGNTAYETTYTVNNHTIFPEITTDQQIALVKNGTTYSLDFQAPTNEFNNEKPNFDIILNSFKIL
jgi:PsbP-like protein